MRIILRPALLLTLTEGESHGYELIEQLEKFGIDGDCFDPSILYRDLREMEADGLISSRWDDEQSKGPQRRVYCIQEAGKQNLEEWIDLLAGLSRRIDQVQDKYQQFKENSK